MSVASFMPFFNSDETKKVHKSKQIFLWGLKRNLLDVFFVIYRSHISDAIFGWLDEKRNLLVVVPQLPIVQHQIHFMSDVQSMPNTTLALISGDHSEANFNLHGLILFVENEWRNLCLLNIV